MKLPRDVSGVELAKRLRRMGYEITRQTSSHLRLSSLQPIPASHHNPLHADLKVGALAAILRAVADHAGLERDKLIEKLFSRAAASAAPV